MSLYLRLLLFGLAIFWLLLSGYWDNGLLLILGLASVLLAGYMGARIERDYQLNSVASILVRLPAYMFWLTIEVIKTNIDVVKRIMFPKRYPITPTLQQVPMTQKTRLGKTIYANSITLTPGTITVRLEPDAHLLVHALTSEGMDDLKAGGMDSRVTDLEE